MAKIPFLTRRGFLRTSLTATLTSFAGAYGYAYWIEPYWLEVVQRDLPIAHLPEALAGRTLVQLSDLHIGEEVDDNYLLKAFEEVARLQPDLMVVTGDFMTCRQNEEVEHVARILEKLPHGKLATIGILGNHDYGRHYHRINVADQLAARLVQQGMTLLRNDRTVVQGLTIAGLDDLWAPLFKPTRVLPMLEPGQPTLILCHNPDAADLPIWGSYQGWILCGHTHGGQCKPPFFRAPIVPVENHRYIAGEIDLEDGRRLYINRGLGHIRHVRFNCRPEITVFTLRRQESASRGC